MTRAIAAIAMNAFDSTTGWTNNINLCHLNILQIGVLYIYQQIDIITQLITYTKISQIKITLKIKLEKTFQYYQK